MRRFAEWAVYGFLRWFESFNSVWQTTLVCICGTVFEDSFPRLDPGHLVFLLILSLYATFTQNGLGHGNKLTAAKVDEALRTLLRLAENESGVQEALVRQTDVIVAQTSVVADAVGGHSEELDALLELARRTELLAARVDENERAQTVLIESRAEMFDRIDTTLAELAQGLADDAERRRKLAMRISDIGKQ